MRPALVREIDDDPAAALLGGILANRRECRSKAVMSSRSICESLAVDGERLACAQISKVEIFARSMRRRER